MATSAPAPAPAPAPVAPQAIPTDPALLAELKADNAQDEKLGRDAIAAADARFNNLAGSVRAMAEALGREQQFVSDCLAYMSATKDFSVADVEARARGLMAVRRKMFAELGAAEPAPATTDPPSPASSAPATLSATQALRYLQTFADEFKAAGITTPDQAAKHWQQSGRAEWLAGDQNRRRFTP